MSPLFLFLLLFLLLLAPSQASYNIPGFNSCQVFPNRPKGVAQRPFDHELHFIVDDTVDIHAAAVVLQRLMCVLSEHFLPRYTGFLVGAPRPHEYTAERDTYERFSLMLNKSRTRRKDLCARVRFKGGKLLIFTTLKAILCPGYHYRDTFNIMVGSWLDLYFAPKAVNQFNMDVQRPESLRFIYDLAYRLAEVPFNSSLVKADSVWMKRRNESNDKKGDDSNDSNRIFVGLVYLFCLLIAIFILFFSLLNLLNVNEHYLFVLHAIIRQRGRRRVQSQRARMEADNGENGAGAVEEGEEAVERPNRRNRLNSEERSLLGTDENTIRTALSSRFPSTLSFHSTDSNTRKSSLNSLEEVVVDPSDDVTVDGKEEEKKLNK